MRPRSAYVGLPRKGTKKRELLRRMLSNDGITCHEALSSGLSSSQARFHTALSNLKDHDGWHVVSMKNIQPDRGNPLKKMSGLEKVYLVVGRIRPNRYKDLTSYL